MIRPLCIARWTSVTLFAFCGTSPRSNFSKRARRWVFTASTLRCSSAAISLLPGGRREGGAVLEGPAQRDEHAPLRRRDAGGGERVGRDHRRLLGGAGRTEEEARAAGADDVPVGKLPPAGHSFLVDERAVRREAVVDERAIAADDLDLRVQLRGLGIPIKRDVGGLRPADPQLTLAVGDDQQLLRAIRIAVGEERPALALGLDLSLELPTCNGLGTGAFFRCGRHRLRLSRIGKGRPSPSGRPVIRSIGGLA